MPTESSNEYGPYHDYLTGDVWPRFIDGMLDEKVYVPDMPPQYAAAALAKLKRWVRGGFMHESDMEEAEMLMRQTPLARMLTARATSVDDVIPASYTDEPQALERDELAKVLMYGMFDYCQSFKGCEPMAMAQMATELAVYVRSEGYKVMRP
jgi:hypothetical protein